MTKAKLFSIVNTSLFIVYTIVETEVQRIDPLLNEQLHLLCQDVNSGRLSAAGRSGQQKHRTTRTVSSSLDMISIYYAAAN